MDSVDDWEQFRAEVSWFLDPGESPVVGHGERWSRGPIDGLPALSLLLSDATVTHVSVEASDYELIAWGAEDARRGWLCLPPTLHPVEGIHPVHQKFLAVCGGIIERFREPPSWWNNQDAVMTEAAAETSVEAILTDYAWLWADDNLELPINPDDFYVVAVEANGNLTLAHRVDGRVIVFAPDHAFDDVTPLPGCPPYSLMSIDSVPDLSAWMEACAHSWTRR